jgi:hypothetical protein
MAEVVLRKHPTIPAAVKVGHLLAITHYVRVTEVIEGGTVLGVRRVDGDRGGFNVNGASLVEQALSADTFSETVSVTMTEAARILIEARNVPFTVCFRKQPGPKNPEGELRSLRGRYVKHEELLGRSMVEDLDLEGPYRLRQVDHRTIQWLIVCGTKYVVK